MSQRPHEPDSVDWPVVILGAIGTAIGVTSFQLVLEGSGSWPVAIVVTLLAWGAFWIIPPLLIGLYRRRRALRSPESATNNGTPEA